jgi:hypothetical protein
LEVDLEIALSESAGGAAAAALVRGFVILLMTAFFHCWQYS